MSASSGSNSGSFDESTYDSEMASRHAESLANVAAALAESNAAETRRLDFLEVIAGRSHIVPN